MVDPPRLPRDRAASLPAEWTRGAPKRLSLGREPLTPQLIACGAEADILCIGVDRLDELSRFPESLPLRLTYKTRGELARAKAVLPRVREVEVDVGTGPIDDYKPIVDADLKSLRGATGLRELDLRYRAKITDAGLETLSAWEGLERLAFGGPSIGSLRHLASPSKLQALIFSFTGTPATAAETKTLSRCNALRYLDAQLNEPGRVLDQLELPELRHLSLDLTGPLASAKMLRRCTKLERLALDAALFPSDLPDAIGSLSKLASIQVHGPASDALFEAVTGSSSLRYVSTGLDHIGREFPSGPKIPQRDITDAALVALSRAKNLRGLRVRGHFTDRGLRALSKLKGLTYLSVNGSFTTEGFEALSKLEHLRSIELSSPNEATAQGLVELHGAGRLESIVVSSPKPDATKVLKKAFGARPQTDNDFGVRTLRWIAPSVTALGRSLRG